MAENMAEKTNSLDRSLMLPAVNNLCIILISLDQQLSSHHSILKICLRWLFMKNQKRNRKANMHAKKILVFGDLWIWAYAFLFTWSLQPYLYLCISSLLLKRTYVLDLSTTHFSNINKTEMGCQYNVIWQEILWQNKNYCGRKIT